MLVGYSSSSSEEENESLSRASDFNDNDESNRHRGTRKKSKDAVGGEDDDDDRSCSARKRLKTEEEQPPKTRLPVPVSLLAMFPDEEEKLTEDSSCHGGRLRSFKHERGNWATYVYFPYCPDEEFMDLLEELLMAGKTHGVALTKQEEFHLSLSQTVVLRHHWIQPFTQSLREGLVHCNKFVCTAGRLKVYSNAERTRTFLGMEVSTAHTHLLELVRVVDRTMKEFRLDTFYKNPSFHVSLAWCVGDLTEQIQECLPELQALVDDHEEGPFLLRLDCQELRCKAGNKTFSFPLSNPV